MNYTRTYTDVVEVVKAAHHAARQRQRIYYIHEFLDTPGVYIVRHEKNIAGMKTVGQSTLLSSVFRGQKVVHKISHTLTWDGVQLRSA